MKNYHECEKVYIGDSDIAALVFVGMMDEKPWLKAQMIMFNIDASYRAYVINGNEAEQKIR